MKRTLGQGVFAAKTEVIKMANDKIGIDTFLRGPRTRAAFFPLLAPGGVKAALDAGFAPRAKAREQEQERVIDGAELDDMIESAQIVAPGKGRDDAAAPRRASLIPAEVFDALAKFAVSVEADAYDESGAALVPRPPLRRRAFAKKRAEGPFDIADIVEDGAIPLLDNTPADAGTRWMVVEQNFLRVRKTKRPVPEAVDSGRADLARIDPHMRIFDDIMEDDARARDAVTPLGPRGQALLDAWKAAEEKARLRTLRDAFSRAALRAAAVLDGMGWQGASRAMAARAFVLRPGA